MPIHIQRNRPSGDVATMANKVLFDTYSALEIKCATSSLGTYLNHLYALTMRQDSESSPNVVTGKLKNFSCNAYLPIFMLGLPIFM